MRHIEGGLASKTLRETETRESEARGENRERMKQRQHGSLRTAGRPTVNPSLLQKNKGSRMEGEVGATD